MSQAKISIRHLLCIEPNILDLIQSIRNNVATPRHHLWSILGSILCILKDFLRGRNLFPWQKPLDLWREEVRILRLSHVEGNHRLSLEILHWVNVAQWNRERLGHELLLALLSAKVPHLFLQLPIPFHFSIEFSKYFVFRFFRFWSFHFLNWVGGCFLLFLFLKSFFFVFLLFCCNLIENSSFKIVSYCSFLPFFNNHIEQLFFKLRSLLTCRASLFNRIWACRRTFTIRPLF